MKLQVITEPVLVNMNGLEIKVPDGINFLTIDMNAHLQGWITVPRVSDGYWKSSIQPISLGFVELSDEGDIGWEIFDVKHNDWYNSWNYD